MIGAGNLLDMFKENAKMNKVVNGNLVRIDPPQVVGVNSSDDLESLGELPVGSIAYTDSAMWQLTASGSWDSVSESGGGGGGGGGLVVHLTYNDGVFTADHTAGEILDAAGTGAVIVTYINPYDEYQTYIYHLVQIENYLDDVEYPGDVSFLFSGPGDNGIELTASSADDYPSYDPNPGT